MSSKLKSVLVAHYKARLKRAYLNYCQIRDEYSCGKTLAEHLSSRLRRAKGDVNRLTRKLQQLDPDNAPRSTL